VFRAHVERPVFHDVVRRFIDGPVTIYRAVLFNNSARGGSPIPWHQDGGRLWGVAPDPFLQMWTALDDCGPDAGCLEVLPGSHVGGLATPLGGVVPTPLADARAHAAVAVPGSAKSARVTD
jgi:phytanoyl-CoA hydroxylase